MKKNNFSKEIALAEDFIAKHNRDNEFMGFLRELKNGGYSHSEKWSLLYDYCEDRFGTNDGKLITGLTYHLEKK